MIKLGTKGETLERLANQLKTAKILPQVRFSLNQYRENNTSPILQIKNIGWIHLPLIVRSSTQAEDQEKHSLAGHYTSILNVKGERNVKEAIEKVISGFDNQHDQVLIQPMLQQITISGVAFSKNPTSGAPYILINYDDTSGSTTSVTSGNTNDLKAYCHYRYSHISPPSPLDKVLQLLIELEEILGIDHLDIEFAFTASGDLYLLQARPLTIHHRPSIDPSVHTDVLHRISQKIERSFGAHPYLHGTKTIYGIMPDWNPAEIIGLRPKSLALSLYKELITDSIWAYQRDNYGYRNLRSFPLLIDFQGLPYIDVRVSFNSFIPKELDPLIAEKLTNYYLKRLEECPNYHDKVEFEIIYSCYTLDLPERLEILKEYDFTESELASISAHLKVLTDRIIDGKTGLWKSDIEKIAILEKKHTTILESNLEPIAKIYWLLEDCKRYGTLPFAGLARAGFIAIQLLKSLLNVGILNLEEYNHFFQTTSSISSTLTRDFHLLEKSVFLQKYGHLRPGTYDLLSPRYDEEPAAYFEWNSKTADISSKHSSFNLSLEQLKAIEKQLQKHEINHSIITFFDFIKSAIEGREYSKFIFSKSLSEALSLIGQLGKEYGISRDDCAFIDISCIKKLYASSSDIESTLKRSIEEGKMSYELSKQLVLPPLIYHPDQVYSFVLPATEPNYVTLKTAKGLVVMASDAKNKLKDAILMIPSADPGYDWIFSHNIAGFITMYGGMNSHMAIRANELSIPAVIGAGETLYRQWESAKILEIDCANRLVRKIQ